MCIHFAIVSSIQLKEFLQTPLQRIPANTRAFAYIPSTHQTELSLSLCSAWQMQQPKEEDNDRRGVYYTHTKLLVSKPSTSHMCILSWLLAAHHLEEAGNQSFTSTQTRHRRTTSSPIAQPDARKFLLLGASQKLKEKTSKCIGPSSIYVDYMELFRTSG